MRQKVQPGMILDFLSPEEHLEAMNNQTDTLLKILGKNAQFKRVIVNAPIVAGPSGTNQIATGPEQGFMWDLRGVCVYLPANAGLACGWYINNVSPLNLIQAQLSGNGMDKTFGSKTHIIHSGDQLIMQINAVTVADQGSIQVAVIEVPTAHEAQLLI